MNIEKHHIEISKKGAPCIWETGDYSNSIGFSLVVCDIAGEKKRAIYIPKKSITSSFNHALIPIRLGDIIIRVSFFNSELKVKVYSIINIDMNKQLASVTCKAEYNGTNWSNEDIANQYKYAIMAATQSAISTNAQTPCYVKN